MKSPWPRRVLSLSLLTVLGRRRLHARLLGRGRPPPSLPAPRDDAAAGRCGGPGGPKCRRPDSRVALPPRRRPARDRDLPPRLGGQPHVGPFRGRALHAARIRRRRVRLARARRVGGRGLHLRVLREAGPPARDRHRRAPARGPIGVLAGRRRGAAGGGGGRAHPHRRRRVDVFGPAHGRRRARAADCERGRHRGRIPSGRVDRAFPGRRRQPRGQRPEDRSPCAPGSRPDDDGDACRPTPARYSRPCRGPSASCSCRGAGHNDALRAEVWTAIEAWIDEACPGDPPHDGLSLPLVYFAALHSEN